MAYELKPGDGAFYGPKIDFDVADALGRKWQLGTIQLDYNAPERFDLGYIGADNSEHRPVVIHRAIYGIFERFIGILIEHYAGDFPVWLAPEQARDPAGRRAAARVRREVADEAARGGMRVEIDRSNGKLGAKIRDAQLEKIPYTLVVGDKEVEAEARVAAQARHRQGGRPGLDAARRVPRPDPQRSRDSVLRRGSLAFPTYAARHAARA